MPSGFQQDSNQLQPAFFRVVLDMSDSNIWISDETDDSSGGVNPYSWDNFSENTLPSTSDYARRLARGNIRFQRIIEELTKYADAQIIDVEVNYDGEDADGDLQPYALAFTVRYDRFGIDDDNVEADSPLLAMERQYLRSINDGNTSSQYDGEGINNTDEAIQEAIMRAVITTVTRSTRVFEPLVDSDPTTGEGLQQQIRARDVTNNEDNANYGDLRNTISVNPMDGTTVINQDGDNDAQTTT